MKTSELWFSNCNKTLDAALIPQAVLTNTPHPKAEFLSCLIDNANCSSPSYVLAAPFESIITPLAYILPFAGIVSIICAAVILKLPTNSGVPETLRPVNVPRLVKLEFTTPLPNVLLLKTELLPIKYSVAVNPVGDKIRRDMLLLKS